MHFSLSTETSLAQDAYKEILHDYEGAILPPQHPLTRHVRRIVQRILDANDLGKLEDASGTSGLRDDPRQRAAVADGKRWTLTVVNDPKMVNAAAMFSEYLALVRRTCRLTSQSAR